MNLRTTAVLRMVVIVLAVILALAFFARGDSLIGALLLTLAVTRAVMVAVVMRNRRH